EEVTVLVNAKSFSIGLLGCIQFSQRFKIEGEIIPRTSIVRSQRGSPTEVLHRNRGILVLVDNHSQLILRFRIVGIEPARFLQQLLPLLSLAFHGKKLAA